VTTIIVVPGGGYYQDGATAPFKQMSATDVEGTQFLLLPNYTRCLQSSHGTLTKGDVRIVRGKRVIEVKDDGSTPGSNPGSFFVALDGPALVVRAVTNGPQRPGGNRACGAVDDSTTKTETDEFTYPDPAPQITPPAA
jgi:hypothetical protein